MKNGEVIFTVIGQGPPGEGKGRMVVYATPFFNSSWFVDQSRFVAATMASRLRLPLDDESRQETFEANRIPLEWLDPKRVRMRLKWRRRNA